MQFRPCIDIHNGKVKQIVGSTLRDEGDRAKENFVSEKDAAYYAAYYRERNLSGGHIINLNKEGSEYFEASKAQMLSALGAYPGGMQVGGGIAAENAEQYIEAGASHVIVTSYVFAGGEIHMDRLRKLRDTVGAEHIVLDLSCGRLPGQELAEGEYPIYRLMTDRWQTMTEIDVDLQLLMALYGYCDEFLIHAVDAEGKNRGIEMPLVEMLSGWRGNPITYAGGIHSKEDVFALKEAGRGRINATVGSALDLFGGPLKTEDVMRWVL